VLLSLKDNQTSVLLGGARTVATAGGAVPLSSDGAAAIVSLAQLGLGADPPDVGSLSASTPDELAAALSDAAQAATAAEILAIFALVDGELNRGRIEQVLGFAQALDVHDSWLDDLVKSLDPDLGPIIADMGDKNLRSVTDGRVKMSDIGDWNDWLMPYDGDNADEHLGDRYQELSSLPPGTLGYEFWSFYNRNGFSFAGHPGAVNEMFGTPHDCTHLISGYDTTPQGEILVSTFTSGIHPIYPFDGQVLPVIYSWHLGIEFNKLAGSTTGALDPAKLWVAWDRGLQTSGDTYGPEFDLWHHADEPLAAVRQAFEVPPLDKAHAASSNGAVAGVDYNPIA
jgi:hypothetical protein